MPAGSGSGLSPTTGSLVFSFQRAQATVPSSTTILEFLFRDSQGEEILRRSFPYSASVTVSDVPLTASTVEITARDGGGSFLSNLIVMVAVNPGGISTIDLSGARFIPRFQELQVVLDGDSQLEVLETVTIQSLALLYTDGSSEGIPVSKGALSVDNPKVARLDGAGVVGIFDGSTMLHIEVVVGQELYSKSIPIVVGTGLSLIPDLQEATGLVVDGLPPGAELYRLRFLYTPPFENERVLSFDDPNLSVAIEATSALVTDAQGSPLVSDGAWVVELPLLDSATVTYRDSQLGTITRNYAFYFSTWERL